MPKGKQLQALPKEQPWHCRGSGRKVLLAQGWGLMLHPEQEHKGQQPQEEGLLGSTSDPWKEPEKEIWARLAGSAGVCRAARGSSPGGYK